MTPQAVTHAELSAQSPIEATTAHRYGYPTVSALSLATAHPSSECWPAVSGERRRARALRPPRPARRGRLAAFEEAARAGQARTLVVVPSRTIDRWHEPPAEAQAYEERLLCSLLELRDPSVRMTYVTSSPIAPGIVDYYLSLLPRSVRRSARFRLALVALGERSARPLSEKLLERPLVLRRIRRTIAEAHPSCLVPYNTTELEREVALTLGIPMYGADPQQAHLGTKSGCRELFARAGVPHPAGREGITSVAAAANAILELRRARPGLTRLVLKLNEGVSGEGNALIDVSGLPEPGSPDEAEIASRRVACLLPEASGVSAAAFLAKLARMGGIIEEWIVGEELRSPSVQLQITPFGEVQLLSTHDQILGGPHGQSYLGCRFPAAPSYAPAISALARRVGENLAEVGVVGRFAIDFVVARDGGGWRPFAIELNLRKGGTTHPFQTLAHLTGGRYDAETATFTTPTGQRKHYVATDHLEAPTLRALGRQGVLALAGQGDLRFDRMRRQGTVVHMLSSVDELGRMGFTTIGDSPEEANALYENVQSTLTRAGEAVSSRPLAA